MPKQFLATFSGKDRPGITSEITGALARHPVAILDIAQAVIQNLLSLSIYFEVSDSDPSPPQILAELSALAIQQGLKLEHRALVGGELPEGTPKNSFHYAVTLIADTISAQALHEVTAVLAKQKTNIDVIKRLSEGVFSCVEMIVSSPEEFSERSKNAVKKELLGIAKKLGVDIALQAEGLYRRAKRLVVLDMDSTLIQGEVIDELAHFKGVYDRVSAITHQAMNGKMDFDESLRQRVKMLKGTSLSDLDTVFKNVKLTPGAEDLIGVLKKLGYKIALISGGFTYVADRLKTQLGIDFVYANQLEIQGGLLTGNVIPPIVNAQRKADLLDVIAQQERIELDQVIAIGDGANDLLMLEKAGLGIAFNAKPTVREKADLALSRKNLSSILYLLGMSEKELKKVQIP